MRIPFDELKATFEEILKSRGIKEETARISAENFAASSADGVYTHGVNRFPKVISYLERGLINGNGEPERVFSMGAVERWDGHMGLGNVNAKKAMGPRLRPGLAPRHRHGRPQEHQSLDAGRSLRLAGRRTGLHRPLLDKQHAQYAALGRHRSQAWK